MSLSPAKPDLVTVNIDGKEIAVPKGTNVIEAARLVGVDVPHYCYHPKLTDRRQLPHVSDRNGHCLRSIRRRRRRSSIPPTGKQKINWMPASADRLRHQRVAGAAHSHQHAA